jgi:integrase
MATIEKRNTGEGVTYRVKVRIKGHPAQCASFGRLTDARRWAQSTEAAIRERRYFKTTEAQRHTVGEMIDRYVRDIIPEKGRWARDQVQQLLWWRGEFGTLFLADVTPAVIGEARDKLARMTVRGSQRSPSTVIRYMAALSHAFALAIKEWGWLEDSPLRKVSRPREPRGRIRFLSDEERTRLLQECRKSRSRDLYIAVVLSLSTGARRAEILGLRWPQVDFDRRAITLLQTKNGEVRSLPLVNHALELVKERSRVRCIDTDLVFPARQRSMPINLRDAFHDAMRRAEIKNFRWHDLRHCTASYLAMNGATLAEIAEVLGHKTLAMVKRYAHLSQAHTTRVVEDMNSKIFG